MNQEHEIVRRIAEAKTNTEAADRLVRDYLPFIKAETAKFLHRPPVEGQDDELSIAMFAFYEAVLNYEKAKGAFFPFAARGIHNRLIDHYRKESRHGNVISLHMPDSQDEDRTILETLGGGTSNIEERQIRLAAKEEIEEYARQLRALGLSLSDVADNCPKQERTLEACHNALSCAKSNQELLERFLTIGKLPLTELSKLSGTAKKTLERHRKYMAALLLAYTNGYEIIRGHLCQISSGKGGGRR
ncbi:RNA polymerase subunit sigma [Lachnospiraceae bacterium KGMB03038]|nr:RNA polymerase subunit sigma [Lachnospiraceae bacterium KGMB03038]